MSNEISIGNLYDMNKELIKKNGKALSLEELHKTIHEVIRPYLEAGEAMYYMLLNHERRDYTVFRLKTTKPTVVTENDIYDCLYNRGRTYSIEKVPDESGIEIWLKSDDEFYCYYLFPYDIGVLES